MSILYLEVRIFKGVDATCSGFEDTLSSWRPCRDEVETEDVLLWSDPETWDGLKFGLSGLETLMVMRLGLGETDLNQTVLLGRTWWPTSMEVGSFGGTILECSKGEGPVCGLTITFL